MESNIDENLLKTAKAKCCANQCPDAEKGLKKVMARLEASHGVQFKAKMRFLKW